MKTYQWLFPTGETIKTKTIADFARKTGIRYSNATSLACGSLLSLHGYMAVIPKTKAKRKRMLTRLVNTRTGQKEILGRSIKAFASKHNVCANDLSKLLNGHKLVVKGWTLEKTLALTQSGIADRNI